MIKVKSSVGLVLSLFLCFACKYEQEEQMKTKDEDLEAIIASRIDSFYTVYERFNYDWLDFFEDEFTNVFPDTPIREISKDSTKAIWENIYKHYEVQLLERGKPSFITSQDMVISHNYFNEIFIHKQTRDTIKNPGTYIIAWRRQADDTWKIAFESVQSQAKNE
ncbi:MAG: hypothetical protein MI974_34380 [Chitinophagales bacterium]|nr:hypothetical protein [Chitinophagales bacterium]